ncbi:hypothetical protein LEMLEM_LOCUS5105, partial [Lemmus lemmus]
HLHGLCIVSEGGQFPSLSPTVVAQRGPPCVEDLYPRAAWSLGYPWSQSFF